jgi:hypothetical protein
MGRKRFKIIPLTPLETKIMDKLKEEFEQILSIQNEKHQKKMNLYLY